ncbi:hypothetical protein B0H13DRAFT_2374830 [Mycena leptocephala]|nr:hypothetical protein B0H13DRAFT_2374830 [Mycena leptocephala]
MRALRPCHNVRPFSDLIAAYPWRWTTPIVLGVFFLLTAVFAAINVPLSAYDIDQQSVFRPNDTLRPLPLSNMIPEIWQHPTGDFTPQFLTVGDRIQLNNSIFIFTITEAFDEDDNTLPVSSFSYYNNPLSEGCDVTSMKATVTIGEYSPLMALAATVTCHTPTLFTLSWSGDPTSVTSESLRYNSQFGSPRYTFADIASDLKYAVFIGITSALSANETALYNGSTVGASVTPCCNCTGLSENQPADISVATRRPCSSIPTEFRDGPISQTSPPGTEVPRFAEPIDLATLFQNTFQSLYHLVRLEFGIILENQIYASPEMFNRTIFNVHIPDDLSRSHSAANSSRILTSNTTAMAQWIDSVRLFNNSDRVPVLPYLRTAPRLKPLGSAITSIFVSMFAMLSVTWTIFNTIAGAFIGSQAAWDASEARLLTPEDEHRASAQTLIEHLNLTVEKNTVAMLNIQRSLSEMQLSLLQMRILLRKHGILEEIDEDTRIAAERELRDARETPSLAESNLDICPAVLAPKRWLWHEHSYRWGKSEGDGDDEGDDDDNEDMSSPNQLLKRT